MRHRTGLAVALREIFSGWSASALVSHRRWCCCSPSAIWSPVVARCSRSRRALPSPARCTKTASPTPPTVLAAARACEKRLAIMKDSRIGTYGALALGFGVALRVAALADMPVWTGAAALIAAHAAARVAPVFVMNALPYAGDTAAMKVSYSDAPVSAHDDRFALARRPLRAAAAGVRIDPVGHLGTAARRSAGGRCCPVGAPADRRLHRRRARRDRADVRDRLPARRRGGHPIGHFNGN